ncbi:MAG: LapA family protein [Deltaproteobacteria bacterium]|nr:LapA family protein [Deltaproteobacteria bacterium]
MQRAKLIVGVIIAAILAALFLKNKTILLSEQQVSVLVYTFTQPVIVYLAVVFALGLAGGWLLALPGKRRRRRLLRDKNAAIRNLEKRLAEAESMIPASAGKQAGESSPAGASEGEKDTPSTLKDPGTPE